MYGGINQGLHPLEWHIIMTHYTSSRDLYTCTHSAHIRLPQTSRIFEKFRHIHSYIHGVTLQQRVANKSTTPTQEHPPLYVHTILCATWVRGEWESKLHKNRTPFYLKAHDPDTCTVERCTDMYKRKVRTTRLARQLFSKYVNTQPEQQQMRRRGHPSSG